LVASDNDLVLTTLRLITLLVDFVSGLIGSGQVSFFLDYGQRYAKLKRVSVLEDFVSCETRHFLTIFIA
jgi:hypothetical protein